MPFLHTSNYQVCKSGFGLINYLLIWLSHFSRSSSELGGGILNETTPFSHLPLLPTWQPFTRHFMFFALSFKNIFWINFLSLVFIHYNVIFMSVITSLLFKKTILLSWNFVIGQVPIWIFLLLFIWLWSDPEKKPYWRHWTAPLPKPIFQWLYTFFFRNRL